MSAQPNPDSAPRDAQTAMEDRAMEIATTAGFFAMVIAEGRPLGMTAEEVQALAKRYLASNAPAFRYWNGVRISDPREEATEARQ